jgi:hypothetical protein
VGGLVHFPRSGTRQSDAEWHDPAADSALRSTRDASRVTWIELERQRDGDDDGDGGGRAA